MRRSILRYLDSCQVWMGELGPWLVPNFGPLEKEEETQKLRFMIHKGLGELLGGQ